MDKLTKGDVQTLVQMTNTNQATTARIQARKDYEAICINEWAKYQAISDPAFEIYKATCATARAACEAEE